MERDTRRSGEPTQASDTSCTFARHELLTYDGLLQHATLHLLLLEGSCIRKQKNGTLEFEKKYLQMFEQHMTMDLEPWIQAIGPCKTYFSPSKLNGEYTDQNKANKIVITQQNTVRYDWQVFLSFTVSENVRIDTGMSFNNRMLSMGKITKVFGKRTRNLHTQDNFKSMLFG